jgi:hypothetical protein
MALELDNLLAIERAVITDGQDRSGEVKMHSPGLKMYTALDVASTPDNRKRIWPLAVASLLSVGQSVMTDRGNGRPHKGVDLHADAGSPVIASHSGRVIRVVDGRVSKSDSQQSAGLWVDVLGSDGYVYRYLHLGSSTVSSGQQLQLGDQVGTVAPRGTSGLKTSDPHLHFEIRTSDWKEDRQPWARKKGDKLGDYGPPMDPLKLLPQLSERPRSKVADVEQRRQQQGDLGQTPPPSVAAPVLASQVARAFVEHREVKTAGPSGLVGGLLLLAMAWKALRKRALS